MPPLSTPPVPDQPWLRALGRRWVALWPLKAAGTTAFIWLFFEVYFYVLHHPGGPTRTMPLTPLDGLVGPSVLGFPIYASLWVYVSLAPALLGSFRALLRYGVWVSLLCLVCLALFWAFPTQVPPAAARDWAAYPGMALLKGIDSAGNACPSLHVASAVFTAVWLQRLLIAVHAPPVWRVVNAVACLAIAWSTLATQQHVVLDVAAGAAIGALCAWLSLRRPGTSLQAPLR